MFGFVAQLILTPILVPERHYINREESSIHRVQIGPRRKVTNSVKALTVCDEEQLCHNWEICKV